MKVLWTIKIILLLVVLSGCYYDVEEVLYPSTGCDTLDISFNKDIVPIIEVACYACHSAEANFANITLEGYEMLSIYVANKKLIGSIKYEAGFSPMPKGAAKLLDCEIEKIESWINNGALNN